MVSLEEFGGQDVLLTDSRNFELPRVKSINTSGHKFGLVYAGVGWIVWRDEGTHSSAEPDSTGC